MPQRFFFLGALLLLILGAGYGLLSSHSSENAPGIEELYSDRLLFDATDQPIVTVGMMQGQTAIEFQPDQDAMATVQSPTPRRMALKGKRTYRIVKEETQPATATFHVVLERLRREEAADLSRRIAAWKEKGIDLSILTVGAVYSLPGGLIDNRQTLLVAGSFGRESDAADFLEAINQTHHVNAFLHVEITAMPRGRLRLEDEEGKPRLTFNDRIDVEPLGEGTITVPRCEVGQGFPEQGIEPRTLQGTLIVTLDRTGRLALVNRLRLETLLRGVVPSEIFSSAPLEALKAQAVAARGQILSKLGIFHSGEPYQLCATQHCQVYKGKDSHHPRTDEAVESTQGEFLVGNNLLIDTVYSASCGGHTENNESAWPQSPMDSLRGRLDAPADDRFAQGVNDANLNEFLDHPPMAYCSEAGYNEHRFRWKRSLGRAELTRLVNRDYDLGTISNLVPLRRGVSGRVTEIRIVGEKGEVVEKGELTIRRLFGNLPSSLFALTRTTASGDVLFEFNGAGYGHGVGMCQTGAIGRARAGHSYRQILSAYYGRAELKKMY